MANADKRNGFQLLTSGGVQTRRQVRQVLVANATVMAPGDAYLINADGGVSRATATTAQANGVLEAVELRGVSQGPVSYDFVPATTALTIIGVEDSNAEFEVTATVALAQLDYDAAAAILLTDTAPSTNPVTSKQAVGAIGAGGFKLVRPVDRPGNDKFAQYARVVVRLLPANIQ